MTRETHVPIETLTELAWAPFADPEAAAAPTDEVLAHLRECDRCGAEFARLVDEADEVRRVAVADADAQFSDGWCDAQRIGVLDRLASLGQVGRVLAFPHRSPAAAPSRTLSRRWVTVAAAAGLIIGLFVGQVLQVVSFFGPAASNVRMAAPSEPEPAAGTEAAPLLVPVLLSEDELLEEVDTAIQLRRATSLRAIDALTPTAADLLAVR